MFIVTDFDTLLQAMSLEFGIYHEIVFERFDWRKSLAFTAFQRRGLKEGCSGSCISGRPVTASRDLEALHQRYRQGQTPVGRLDERALGGVRANQSQRSRRGTCLTGRAVNPVETRAAEEMEPVEACRHDASGAGKWEGKGGKWVSSEKQPGTSASLYVGEGQAGI
jgi:hypothetical protein